MKKQRKRRGFADTKKYPHEKHPANYKNLGNDEIEYIVFTHHKEVEIKGKKIKTVPLNSNISPKERKENKNSKSYAYPKKYKGKRSALGKNRNDLSLTKEDKVIVDNLFEILPVEHVSRTGGKQK